MSEATSGVLLYPRISLLMRATRCLEFETLHVIASEAKQSISPPMRKGEMDCFVAFAPRNDGNKQRACSPDGAQRNPGCPPADGKSRIALHSIRAAAAADLHRKGIAQARAAIRKQHLFFETPSPSSRSSRGVIFHEAGSAPCAFKRSSHVKKMDFADPDVVARFEWGPASKSARFTRHRLYRRAAVQQRVPVLYGRVCSGIVCPAPRGTRDQCRGTGRG